MKTAVINSKDLKECWSPRKYLADCVGCRNYRTCTLPDRRRNRAYDELLHQKECIRTAFKDVEREIIRFENGHA